MKDSEFENIYRYERHHWWYRSLRRMIATHLAAHAAGRSIQILDGGCGTGSVLQSLKRYGRAFGVDYSPVAISFCRRLALQRTAVGSLLQLPFADATFDAVVSCDVLCHKDLTDPEEALSEMARVLKPGGILLMNLPAYQWLLSSHDHAVSNDKRFSAGEILHLLGKTSLTSRRLTYWNCFLFPLLAAYRLFRRLFPSAHSDLPENEALSPANGLFVFLAGLECRLTRLVSLPYGLSLFVVAEKKAK